VLISFDTPSAGMRAEAAEAGFYTSPWGKHPRIQLRTVGDLNRPDFGGDSILWRKMESWQSAAAVPTPPNGGTRRS
jgi:hypothetical protein